MLGHELAGFYEPFRRQPLEELRQQHQIERWLGALVHKLGDRQADGARNSPQQHDRDIAASDLELRQIAF